MWGRERPFHPLMPGLQANGILVRVVTVTMSSACRHARMLSPQPCLQQQMRIQIWRGSSLGESGRSGGARCEAHWV